LLNGFEDIRFTQNSLVQETSDSIDLSKIFDSKLDTSKLALNRDFSASEIEFNLEFGGLMTDEFVDYLNSLINKLQNEANSTYKTVHDRKFDLENALNSV